MKPNAEQTRFSWRTEKALKDLSGSIDKAKEDFIQGGVTQFGSGWSWLAVKDGKIQVMKTPNGENPLVHGAKPILGVDVWNTPTTSTIAIAVPTISRRGLITSSTGSTSCLDVRREVELRPAAFRPRAGGRALLSFSASFAPQTLTSDASSD